MEEIVEDNGIEEGDRDKPLLQLSGEDGNAFAILGRARRAARQAGWIQEKIDNVLEEAAAGDYNHLIQVMMKYFDVQ